MKTYRLNKSRSILQAAFSWYKSKGERLERETRATLEKKMLALEADVKVDNRASASAKAEDLELFMQKHRKRSFLDHALEVIGAILIALVLAVVVRQMWFELYEIPTGSMRPTFREQDHVAVTKTPFGINLPLTTGHLLFDPSLVKRGGAITFTSEGIPRLDEDTTFMWVIPYKKRLIKRLIGKPGDSLYFYGGKIYGVDKEGNPIEDLIDAPWMHKGPHRDLEHIPMIRFSGEEIPFSQREVRFYQMNIPVGRFVVDGANRVKGEIFDGKKWILDDPASQNTNHRSPKAYADFFGINNFAMARLLTAKQVKEITGVDLKSLPEGELYLELSHHPSLTYPAPLLWQDVYHPFSLSTFKSILPLKQEHIDRLMESMYTARLVFKNGKAGRYSVDGVRGDQNPPSFAEVPDGVYEFYDGKLESIGRAGVPYAVPENPLYSHDPVNVQALFNLGIEMHSAYSPSSKNAFLRPSRYAYFREGDLYLLGSPVFKKGDPLLVDFLKREEELVKASSKDKPYVAFKDQGPPIKNGQYDVDFIRAFGVTIPEKQYLVLGDNHAMSGDSRAFGFVPEDNLQGAPSLIMWPPGSRWGLPWQAPYAIFVLPRLIVWTVAAIAWLVWYWFHRRHLRRPIILKKA